MKTELLNQYILIDRNWFFNFDIEMSKVEL